MKKVRYILACQIKGTGITQTEKEMVQGRDHVIVQAAPVTLV